MHTDSDTAPHPSGPTRTSPVLGIDLGATNSCVAVVRGGEAVVIPSPDGGRTLPSVVALTPAGAPQVGHACWGQAVTNPTHTAVSVKRLMGRSIDDAAVQRLQAQVTYAVVPGPGRLQRAGRSGSLQPVGDENLPAHDAGGHHWGGTDAHLHGGLPDPAMAAQGSYVFKIGVFGVNWTPLYAWNNGAATFTVGG